VTYTEARASGQRRRVIFTLFVMLFFGALLIAVYVRSPFAIVRSVVVTGEQNVPVQSLLRDSGIYVGENLFKVPTQQAQVRLKEDFPILAHVSIARSFLSQVVTIKVNERALAGILAVDGVLYRVLADGTVLDRDPTGVGVNAPIITTSYRLNISLGQPVSVPAIRSLCSQLPALPSFETAQLSELHVEDYQARPTVLAFTRDGFEVRMPVAGLESSLQLYVAIHSKLTASHVAPGLIDLMNSQEAVYKPFKGRVIR